MRLPALAIMLLALSAGAAMAIAPLPPPLIAQTGRIVFVSLPYRTSDHLIWVSGTRMMESSPFTFKSLDLKPHAGPGGTDLAVFTYVADKAGSATLKFGLVPPGKLLTGPPTMVYKAPPSQLFQTKVTAP